MAKVGMARPMFTMDTARKPPRRTWPRTTADGTASSGGDRDREDRQLDVLPQEAGRSRSAPSQLSPVVM